MSTFPSLTAEWLRCDIEAYEPEIYKRRICRTLWYPEKYFENPALTTDVIVGFPGETEEEFEASRNFVGSIDFYETHIFKYSRREGTKAAVMPDQVSEGKNLCGVLK